MIKVGLTGGIGSGKTTVSAIFSTLGVPVYDSDLRAKSIVNSTPKLKLQIINLLGQNSYIDGTYNRSYISEIVFQDSQKLEALNALIHPYTIEDASIWFQTQRSPYAIKEAAILFESGSHATLDYIIGVTAPMTMRIERVMNRDGITAEQVLHRISKQMDDDEKMKLCNTIILNDENHSLIDQVLKLHQQFTNKG